MLIFQNHTINEAYNQAVNEYPVECCGVLLGKRDVGNRSVYMVVPTKNAAKTDRKQTHFLIHPLELVRVERLALEQGLEIVGFYHSHPDYTDEASKEDISHMILGYSYPIFSIRKGKCVSVSSYEKISWQDTSVQRENIKVEEG